MVEGTCPGPSLLQSTPPTDPCNNAARIAIQKDGDVEPRRQAARAEPTQMPALAQFPHIRAQLSLVPRFGLGRMAEFRPFALDPVGKPIA
jgi:hypothetical protein